MEITDVQEAQTRLSQLIERALRGEEVIIARDGAPVVRLEPIGIESPRRVGGQWRGRVKIAEDFDALPDDIAEAFGGQSPGTPIS